MYELITQTNKDLLLAELDIKDLHKVARTLAENTSEISLWIVYLDNITTTLVKQLNLANKRITELEEKLNQYDGEL